ncbi:MAG: hypothetical protein M3460_25405 [Actinomycetota bacterium]|nr:hypothetical protein [Actinomycetota bacterium]
MTEPEGTPQDDELNSESSTGEATTDVTQEAPEEEGTSDYQEAAEEKVTADYQTRMEQFDNVEASVPVTSLPTKSRDLGKNDPEV